MFVKTSDHFDFNHIFPGWFLKSVACLDKYVHNESITDFRICHFQKRYCFVFPCSPSTPPNPNPHTHHTHTPTFCFANRIQRYFFCVPILMCICMCNTWNYLKHKNVILVVLFSKDPSCWKDVNIPEPSYYNNMRIFSNYIILFRGLYAIMY